MRIWNNRWTSFIIFPNEMSYSLESGRSWGTLRPLELFVTAVCRSVWIEALSSVVVHSAGSRRYLRSFESYRNGTNQPHHVIAVEVGTSGTYSGYSNTKEVVKIWLSTISKSVLFIGLFLIKRMFWNNRWTSFIIFPNEMSYSLNFQR
jgi:hypothetical protein